jgi:hypothetical protein
MTFLGKRKFEAVSIKEDEEEIILTIKKKRKLTEPLKPLFLSYNEDKEINVLTLDPNHKLFNPLMKAFKNETVDFTDKLLYRLIAWSKDEEEFKDMEVIDDKKLRGYAKSLGVKDLKPHEFLGLSTYVDLDIDYDTNLFIDAVRSLFLERNIIMMDVSNY